MKIGINWISPPNFSVIKDLLTAGSADFCEIMVDNFIHLSPEKIRAKLPQTDFAFHLVASRFLERPPQELNELGDVLKYWQDILQPIYISDHIVQHTNNKMFLPVLMEYDYQQQEDLLLNKVRQWQKIIAHKIYFENHASITLLGKHQADFYKNLITHTDAGLLFDISNAYIAEQNQICAQLAWRPLIAHTRHFHIAGFRRHPKSNLLLDTHDQPIDAAVCNALKTFLPDAAADNTLVVEFAAQASLHDWQTQIAALKSLYV